MAAWAPPSDARAEYSVGEKMTPSAKPAAAASRISSIDTLSRKIFMSKQDKVRLDIRRFRDTERAEERVATPCDCLRIPAASRCQPHRDVRLLHRGAYQPQTAPYGARTGSRESRKPRRRAAWSTQLDRPCSGDRRCPAQFP